MLKAINEKSVPHCLEGNCDGLVKPDIVFFGEQLPSEFFTNMDLPAEADLCIVMGTSLSVAPFARLPQFCTDRTPRVLINQEAVGGLGSRPDDVLMLGDCDTGVRKLAEACGWLEELESMWAKTAPEKQPKTDKEKAKKSRDEQLQEEVEKLTKEIEESLRLEQEQHQWLDKHIDNKFAKIQEETEKEVPTTPATQFSLDQEAQRQRLDKDVVVGSSVFSNAQSDGPSQPAKKLDQSQHSWLNQHMGNKVARLQAEDSIEETLQPVSAKLENEAKSESPSASQAEASKTDPGGGGLQHVYPHLR